MTNKPFKFGFIVGRFNHIHKGHESLIDKGLEMCENLLVMVGSSQESGTMRNPFTIEDRMYMIRQVYGDRVRVGFLPDTTHEDDVNYDWGKYVLKQVKLWASVYNIQPFPNVMIYGDDEERGGWYDPNDIKDVVQVVVPRGKIDISATMLRRYLIEDNKLAWEAFVNPKLHCHFGTLRKLLFEIPEYKEMFTNAPNSTL